MSNYFGRKKKMTDGSFGMTDGSFGMTDGSFGMLAVPYDAKKLRPDAEYFASEKLDGVRATWDGAVLKTRTGKVVEGAPDWFLASLPQPDDGEVFDGELFAGRGNFAVATSTVRRKNGVVDTDWRHITYKIFDCFGQEE